MNESQIQTPQTQLPSHPSPSSGVAQNNIDHTHQQMGHGSKNVSRRGADHNVREQDERMQDMLSLDRNFAKHKVHHTSRSGIQGTSLGASAVGTHNADPQSRAEQLEPVRDSGRSCDQKSTNQSPGSIVTQMQRVSHEVAKDPSTFDAVKDSRYTGKR